jgi:hypothetical protein
MAHEKKPESEHKIYLKQRRMAARVARMVRRQKVLALRLQGVGYIQAGARLGISTSQAHRDFEAVEKMWRKDRERDVGILKEEERQKLLLLEREAWGGWERSQQEQKKAKQKGRLLKGEEGGEKQKGMVERYEIETKTPVGDPRYLQILLNVRERMAKLFGLDEEEEHRGDGFQGLNLAVVIRQLESGEGPLVVDEGYIHRLLEEHEAAAGLGNGKPSVLEVESKEVEPPPASGNGNGADSTA